MLKNVSSNWILTLVQILTAFFLLPFTIKMLGKDQYGTWLIITSLTTYLSMLALGVPMATVRFVARLAAGDDQEELNRTVGSCLGLYLLIGVAAMVVGIILFFVFRAAYDVPAEIKGRAQIAFVLTVVYIATGFVAQLPYGIMAAYDDFVMRNRIQIGGLVLRLGLTWVLLTMDASIVWLAVIQLATLVFEFVIASIVVRRKYPRIHIRLSNFDRRVVRQIFSFSAFVLLLQVGGQLAFKTDSLVLGAFVPLNRIPYFEVGSSLAVYLMEFVIAIGSVVMPLATRLEAQGRWDELRVVFLKWSKISLSLTLMVGLFLVFLGPRFVAWWVGPDFELPTGAVLRILIVANFIFLPVRGIALPILMGLGRPMWPAIGFLVASVLNLGLSIVLVRPLGLAGVAWGTAIPNVAYAGYVLLLTCRALKVSLAEYLRYVVLRVAAGTLPVMAALWILRYVVDIHGFVQLFVAGLASVAVFGIVWLVFVYRNDRYVPLGPWLDRVPLLRAFS
jgi:O-antigen/teichoic acid export membrane protein